MSAKAKAKAKAAAPFKPIPVAVQIRRHHRAVVAAKVAAAQPSRVKKAKRVHARVVARKAAQAKKAQHALKHGAPLVIGDVACCAAEAVAESLRQAMPVAVTDADVIALHRAARGDDGEGATLVTVLWAAVDDGLAGHHLRHFAATTADDLPCILGLDLPDGPHAVLATADGWWSWGDLYEPWDAPVAEAWELSW